MVFFLLWRLPGNRLATIKVLCFVKSSRGTLLKSQVADLILFTRGRCLADSPNLLLDDMSKFGLQQGAGLISKVAPFWSPGARASTHRPSCLH